MTRELVSIIVPCYNAAPWLSDTLESALAQTGVDLDIVVIDDGSRDDSLAIAQNYADRGVRIIAQANAGAAAARNTGLAAARGDYIQFLDADDLLGPGKLAAQVKHLQRVGPGFMAAGPWARFHTRPNEAIFRAEPAWRDMSGWEFQLLQLREGWMMPPVAWLTPRTIIDRAGPWDESLSLNDDGEYFCRVMLAAPNIAFCADARSYYRSDLPASLSRRRDARSLDSQYRSIKAIISHLAFIDDSPCSRDAFADGWQTLAYAMYPTLPQVAAEAEALARAAGGSQRRIPGGRLVRWTDRLLGWRAAARVKHWTLGA